MSMDIRVVRMTWAEYRALKTKDPKAVYLIPDAPERKTRRGGSQKTQSKERSAAMSKPVLINYAAEAQDIFAEMDESFACIDRILENPMPDLIELEKFAVTLRSETTYFIQAVRRAIEQAEGGEQ